MSDLVGNPKEGFLMTLLLVCIMFSVGMGHGDKYEDDSLDVFLYFNSSCYKGFGDDKEVKSPETYKEGISFRTLYERS